MTNKQESRLSMYLSLIEFLDQYTTITGALPNYATNLTLFVNTIPEIQRVAAQQKISTKGVTHLKNIYKKALIATTGDYARKLGAFAKFTNNVVLAQEINFSENKIRKIADTAVKNYAQIVYDRAQTNVDVLMAYGISANTQTALLKTINDYNASLGKPGASRTESGNTTRQLDNLFKTADAALENIDASMGIVQLSQRDFHVSYKNARKVIGTNTNSVALKGQVTDAVSNKPIKNVSLLFSTESNNGLVNGTKATTKSLVKKTAQKGGFRIKSLPEGMYTVTVKKVGYIDHVATVAVANGEKVSLYIQLSKS